MEKIRKSLSFACSVIFLLILVISTFTVPRTVIAEDVRCDVAPTPPGTNRTVEIKTGGTGTFLLNIIKEGNKYTIYQNGGPREYYTATGDNYFAEGAPQLGNIVSLKFSTPGEFVIQVYDDGGKVENDHADKLCTGSVTFKVSGTPPSPTDQCVTEYTKEAESEFEITSGETVNVAVKNIVASNIYYIKSNEVQVAQKTATSQDTIYFDIPLNDPGKFELSGWHKVQTGDTKCKFPLTVTVKGNGGGGSTSMPGSGAGGDPAAFASKFAAIAIGIAGGVAFLLMIYGSFRLVFSNGDVEAVQQGRQVIVAAVTGLIVVIFSVFLLHLIGISILGLPI
jgi:hypothetical protein